MDRQIFNENDTLLKLFSKEYLAEINYMLDDIENNIEFIKKDNRILDIYRKVEKIDEVKHIFKILYNKYIMQVLDKEDMEKKYGNLIKFDKLDAKTDQILRNETKIYIPISREVFNNIISKKQKSMYVVSKLIFGTHAEVVAKTRNIKDIKDLIILEITNENVPYCNLDDIEEYKFKENHLDYMFNTVLIPPYNIEFDKTMLSKINEVPETELEKTTENINAENRQILKVKAFTKTNIAKEYNDFRETIEKRRKEVGEKEILDIDRDICINEQLRESKIKKLKLDSLIQDNVIKKYIKLLKDLELQNQVVKVLETEKTEMEKDLSDLNSFLNSSKQKEIKESEKQDKINEVEEYENSILENSKKQEEIQLNIKNTKEKIDEKFKLMKEFKEKYLSYIFDIKSYLEEILIEEIEQEKIEMNNIDKEQLTKLEQAIRINQNSFKNMLEDIESLIKKQQKYAKIGAETDSKYSSLIDGFALRREAEKAYEMIKDIYSKFQEYYFNKLNKNITDEEYEKNLGKYLEASEQISIFINYLYNPKMKKTKNDLNRFSELILIEENEIKRTIEKEVDRLIGEANLIIIDDEIDEIEFISIAQKVFRIITGKHRIDIYKIEKLEELAEIIDSKIKQEYTLNRNYKIHNILAKIMIFKADNVDNKELEKYYNKLSDIEQSIDKNFVISEKKALARIDELKSSTSLMTFDELTKEEEIDLDMAKIQHKYEYDIVFKDENIKYVDTTINELKQIVEYIKNSF
ncbi:MAG: hypothetical protein ACTTGJ_00650 [Clostridium sp.]